MFSILSRSGRLERGAWLKGRDALQHRGPDGAGVWCSPDGRTALAHTRLSVIDLEGGAQPFTSEDGQVIAVVNGELYGFEEIREELEQRGHRFRTQSDGEIVVHLYEDYGVGCLTHLRGEFALIIWDQREERLFAARDRFGVKPLCFLDTRARLYLASEAKAIFAAGERPSLDREAFLRALTLQYPPEDRSLFCGVRQLRAGHYLLADRGGLTQHRWWDLDFPRDEERDPVAAQLAVEGVLGALDEAVQLRLRADVPVAVQLSGGLDSSLVLALAARHSSAPLRCFAVSFPGGGSYDERALAEGTAELCGATLEVVSANTGDLLDAISDAVFASEGLAVNGHLMAKHLLHRAVHAAGYKVVLTGEGSDEVFFGYPHFVRDLLNLSPDDGLALRSLTDQHRASAGIMLPAGEALPLAGLRRRLGFAPTFLEAKATLGFRLRAVLRDDVVAELGRRDPFCELLDELDVEGQLAGRHPVDQSAYLWLKVAFASYLLRTLGDGTEMWHGVEGRLPYLDHLLFELARRIPPAQKIQQGVEKQVLRLAARNLVSPAILARRKHPFLAPPLSGGSGALPEGVMDVFRSTRFQTGPFFDPAKLERLIQALPPLPSTEKSAVDPVLMMALTTALVAERFCA